MTEHETAAADLDETAQDNAPQGEGSRPPGANQRGDEATEPDPDDSPKGAERPSTGVFRPSAPSGEVSPH